MAMEVISKVEEGQQAIVITLLAKNPNGAIIDSQLELAINMAKNVLQMGGAEVAAAGSAIKFDAVAKGKYAILKAKIETYDSPDAATDDVDEEEPVEETDDVETDETDEDGEEDGAEEEE